MAGYGRLTLSTERKTGGFLGGRPAYRFVIKGISGGKRVTILAGTYNHSTVASAKREGSAALSNLRSNIASGKRRRR